MKANFNPQRETVRRMASKLYITRYLESLEDTFCDSRGYTRMPIIENDNNELLINISKGDINILVSFRSSYDSKPVWIKASVRNENTQEVISEAKRLNLDWNTTEDFINAIYELIGRCYCISR